MNPLYSCDGDFHGDIGQRHVLLLLIGLLPDAQEPRGEESK